MTQGTTKGVPIDTDGTLSANSNQLVASQAATKTYVDARISTPAALTKVDDTNVILTLGGTPATALLQATSISAGWTGQLAVSRGGTGLASATAYAVLCGGTTSTGAFQSIASVGTAGQVLTSNGAGALPTFQTPSAAVLVAGVGTDSIATTFGNGSSATRGIRIGKDPADPTSRVLGDDGIGIGSCSYVGTNAICIGTSARCQGTDAIGIGNAAKAGSGFGGGDKSIAIGYLANVGTYNNAMMLTTTSSQPTQPAADGEWILSAGATMYFYINLVAAVKIGTSLDLINLKGTADQSYSLQTPTTGFSITIGSGVKTLILNPAGTLANGTITMPASPINGQEVRVCSSQIVTSLTVSANAGQTITGAPTTIGVGGGFAYIYNSSGTNWYRLY